MTKDIICFRPYSHVLTLLLLTQLLHAQDVIPGTRDPWLWPFESNSIWNMPIGDQAVYEPAGLKSAANVGVDIQHLLELKASFPKRDALGSASWGPGRCESNVNLNFQLNIPDDFIVHDAGNSPYGLTPNANFAFRLPNSDIVFEGPRAARCEQAGPIYFPDWMRFPNNRKHQDIRGNGISGGGQGASGMSALGGTIRLGELTSEEPIRHAIKINPYAARYCYYSAEIPGYKWPAVSADNYARDVYKGENPHIVMGSLLAIPPGVTSESINLTTIPGIKLLFTMQNYGVYFTEDAAWDTWDIIIEEGAEKEFEQTYGFSMNSNTWRIEMNKLMMALSVVTNNKPESIGGGGNPLQPLAPALENPASSQKTSRPDHNTTVKVFPNPVENNILYFDNNVDISLFCIKGVPVMQASEVNNISLHGLSAGLYVVKILIAPNTYESHLIMQK